MTAGFVPLALCETRRKGPVAATANSQGPDSFARIPGKHDAAHKTHWNNKCGMTMCQLMMY